MTDIINFAEKKKKLRLKKYDFKHTKWSFPKEDDLINSLMESANSVRKQSLHYKPAEVVVTSKKCYDVLKQLGIKNVKLIEL